MSLTRLTFTVPRGQNVGSLCYGILKRKIEWSEPGKITQSRILAAFRTEMTKAGFLLVGDPSDLFSQNQAGEFAVGGAVNQIQLDICQGLQVIAPSDEQPPPTFKGKVRMGVEWQIYSGLEKRVVAKVTTTGDSELQRARLEGDVILIAEAFAENVRALINSEAFRAAFVGANRPSNQRVDATKQAPVAMTGAKSSPTISDSVGSVVGILDGGGFGSGVLIGEEGYIVTNSHVVGSNKTMRIRWSDGFETTGEVIRSDRRRDLALIKTSPHGRQPLKLLLMPPQVGASVYAIGMPLDEKFQGTMTKGIVSAMRIFDGFSFIQADVGINHGNSGGPLIDDHANVVGITVSRIEDGGAGVGLNLFIPARDIVDFLSLDLH